MLPAVGGKSRAITETKPTAADVEWLLQNLDQVLHTHSTDLPYKGVGTSPVLERRTLLEERDTGPYISSTTIEGPAFRAAIACGAQTVGAAMRLADDLGYASDGSFLDLVLHATNDLDARTGIPATTIHKLCEKLRATVDTAPAQLSADHAVVYFEAGGEEVLITPVMPVRVLRTINSRLARRSLREKDGRIQIGQPPTRLALRVPQGGAQPQNVAHYVNAGPKVLPDGRVQTTGSRRGGYFALRVRAPMGQRTASQRDLAQVIASGKLATICHVDPDAARLYSRRSRTRILLPGLSARLASLRTAEMRHARELVSQFFGPLFALREALRDAKAKPGNFSRLPAEEARWLNNAASKTDVSTLAKRLADELCTRIAMLARCGLAAQSREAIQEAAAQCLVGSSDQ
jgi:hypothetical protein